MSLINEALKRAQEAQAQAPAAATPDRNLELRPVETAPTLARRQGWLLPCALTATALLTMFCIYEALRSGPAQHVQARVQVTPGTTPVNRIAQTHPASLPRSTGASAQPAPAVAPIPTEGIGSMTNEAQAPASAETVPAPGTAFVPDPVEAPPAPPPPKPAPRLQGIVYSPVRPSAMISGKTVFVGDRVGDMRVLAIEQESVTLFGGGETNVLSLP